MLIAMTASENRKYNRRRLREKHSELRAVLTDSKNMDPDVKRVWLEALRSGEYKQGTYTMCRVGSQGAYSFCCLGVLADECIDTDWCHTGESGTHRLGAGAPASSGALLSGTRLKELGLSPLAQDALANANDGGLRFSTIANAIEECL